MKNCLGVVRVDPDVGQEVVQLVSGRIHHARRELRRHPGSKGHTPHTLHLALVQELERLNRLSFQGPSLNETSFFPLKSSRRRRKSLFSGCSFARIGDAVTLSLHVSYYTSRLSDRTGEDHLSTPERAGAALRNLEGEPLEAELRQQRQRGRAKGVAGLRGAKINAWFKAFNLCDHHVKWLAQDNPLFSWLYISAESSAAVFQCMNWALWKLALSCSGLIGPRVMPLRDIHMYIASLVVSPPPNQVIIRGVAPRPPVWWSVEVAYIYILYTIYYILYTIHIYIYIYICIYICTCIYAPAPPKRGEARTGHGQHNTKYIPCLPLPPMVCAQTHPGGGTPALARLGTGSYTYNIIYTKIWYAYIHTYIRTYVRTYIHTYIHTSVHTYIYMYLHICMSIYMRIPHEAIHDGIQHVHGTLLSDLLACLEGGEPCLASH